MDSGKIEQRKEQAKTWFETLRDRIVAAFEAVEDALPATAPLADRMLQAVGEAASSRGVTARASSTAQIDSSITVQYGAQANESAIRSQLQSIAVYAAVTLSPLWRSEGALIR